jgi:hypothetical protein
VNTPAVTGTSVFRYAKERNGFFRHRVNNSNVPSRWGEHVGRDVSIGRILRDAVKATEPIQGAKGFSVITRQILGKDIQ